MSNWSYVLVGVLLGVVLLPLSLWAGFKVFVWILKRKLGDLARGLAGAMPPPLRINLRPLKEEPEWVKTEAARSLEPELLSLGFKRAGDFEVEGLVEEAKAEIKGNKLASAKTKLEIAKSIDPNRFDVYDLLAQVYEQTGEDDKAKAMRMEVQALRAKSDAGTPPE